MRRMLQAGLAAVVVASGIALAAPAAEAAPGGITEFSFVSAPGEFVGQGRTLTLTSSNATFQIGGTAGFVRVRIENATERFGIDIATGEGKPGLRPGVYPDARRASFSDDAPGLDVHGNGRGCNTVVGSFEIHAISADATGAVDMLDASWTQRCPAATNPPITGRIRYNAPPPAPLLLSSTKPTIVESQPNVLTATVPVVGGVAPTGSVTFDIAGSANDLRATVASDGRAVTSASNLPPGAYTIAARYSGDANYPPAVSAPIVQTVRSAAVSVWFEGARGDISNGRAGSFAEPSDQMQIAVARDSVRLTTSDPRWRVDIAPPTGQQLRVGEYQAKRFNDATFARLDLAHESSGCNMSSGSFTVNEIRTDNAGAVLELDLTFRHICDNDVAVHTGRIHYEPQLTKATIDGPNSSRNGKPVDITVTVVDVRPALAPKPTGLVTLYDGAQRAIASAPIDARGKVTFKVPVALGPQSFSAQYVGDGLHAASATKVLKVVGK